MTSTRLLIVGCSSLLASCAPPTAITIEVYTEVDCAANADVSLTVAPDLASLAARAPSSTTRGCTEPGRAGDVVIAPADDREKPLAFAIATRVDEGSIEECLTSPLPSGCIVARRQLRFSPNQELPMRVDLRTACQGIECPAQQTCVKGACVSAEVEPDRCVGGCDETTLPPLSCAPGLPHVLQTVELSQTVSGDSSLQLVDTPSGPVAAWRIVQPGDTSTIHLQPLAFDGAPEGPPSAPIPAGAAASIDFLLGYDGAGYVLVSNDSPALRFRKVDLLGTVLAGPTSVSMVYRLFNDAMPWSGTRFAFLGHELASSDLYVLTMDTSGMLRSLAQVETNFSGPDFSGPAWNGTNFAIAWRDYTGACRTKFFSADGTQSGTDKLVADACWYPNLSVHPGGWNYVYTVGDAIGGSIEYVQLDAQGNPTTPPVVISPQDGGKYLQPRAISLSSGETWVTFTKMDVSADLYVTVLEGGNIVLPASRWPGASAASGTDYAMTVSGGRVHLIYKPYPSEMAPARIESTVLCRGSAP